MVKSDLDEEAINFFITEFTVIKMLKQVKEAPWSAELSIDGIRYSATPRRNILRINSANSHMEFKRPSESATAILMVEQQRSTNFNNH